MKLTNQLSQPKAKASQASQGETGGVEGGWRGEWGVGMEGLAYKQCAVSVLPDQTELDIVVSSLTPLCCGN